MMAVQNQDRPYIFDCLQVLAEFRGMTARNFVAVGHMMLEDEPEPRRGCTPDRADDARFIHECDEKISACIVELGRLAQEVAFEDCASVALLIGQHELHREVSYLSTLLSAHPERRPLARWRQIRAAYNALSLSRRLRVLHRYRSEAERMSHQTSTTVAELEAEVGYRGVFATSWSSVTGYFISEYDLAYCRELQKQLIQVTGAELPDISAIIELQDFLYFHLRVALDRFRQSGLSYSLRALLASRSILSVCLEKSDFQLISQYTDDCTVSFTEALEQYWPQAKTRASIETWLDRLTLDSSDLGGNAALSWNHPPALLDRPIYRSPSGEYLLCLTHRIPTELSQLLHAHWSDQFKERYYKARADALEVVALESLSKSFPGAKSAAKSKYTLDAVHPEVEVDGIILWEDVCLIVESKSAYFSHGTKRGSDNSATSDLLWTVGAGFYQAGRLLRHLQLTGEVQLRTAEGCLTLRSKKIRRAYVILPSADFLGGAPTLLQMFWVNEILPQASVPVIVSVQNLLLIADMLPDHLDLLSYLDYREEILAHQEIHLVDELEILGNFIGGYDVVDWVEAKHLQTRILGVDDGLETRYTVMPNRQETYLAPWLRESARARYAGRLIPNPPQRHRREIRAKLRDMLQRRNDLLAFSLFTHVEDDLLDSLLVDTNPPKRGESKIRRAGSLGVIAILRGEKLRDILRSPTARRMRNTCRLVIYLQYSPPHDVVCAYAERGGRHSFYSDKNADLLGRSRLGQFNDWYVKYEAYRKQKVDESAMAELRSAGVDEDAARGIAARNLQSPLITLWKAGIDVNRAAYVLLGPMSRVADARGKKIVQLNLTARQIRSALTLIENGALEASSLEQLLLLTEERPQSDILSNAENTGLSKSTSASKIEAAVDELLREYDVQALSVEERKGRKFKSRVLGEFRRRYPNLSPSLGNKELEKRLFEI
jgi:GatB domain